MNTPHFAAVLLSLALFALPAYAQQGPAGVPGVVELLIESVTPVIADEPAAPPPSQHPATPPPAAERVIPAESRKAPPAKTTARKLRGPAIEDCDKAKDPARCRLFQKVRRTCEPILGNAHRQCLRDALTARQ